MFTLGDYSSAHAPANPLATTLGRAGLRRVHSRARFRDLLVRERLRARSTGAPLSLVVYAMPGDQRHVRAIASRMDGRDRIGRLDGERIGVLLPGRTPREARAFAAEVERRARDRGVPLAIYSYPESWLDETDVASVAADTPARTPHPLWKRSLDLVVASAALVVAAMPMLLAAILIKVVSRGPVFYRQERIGYLGRPFTFLKLRSMHIASDTGAHRRHVEDLIRSGVPMTKLDAAGDPRIIPGGRLLRALSIDELPQLFNVLRGDMSLVGPRPCLPYEAAMYADWHRERFSILPGITGLWQVSGKNSLGFEQMMRLDIRYARERSLFLDLRILLATPAAIIAEAVAARARRGAGAMAESPRRTA